MTPAAATQSVKMSAPMRRSGDLLEPSPKIAEDVLSAMLILILSKVKHTDQDQVKKLN